MFCLFTFQEENNPFSDSYLQRESADALRQKQGQQTTMTSEGKPVTAAAAATAQEASKTPTPG